MRGVRAAVAVLAGLSLAGLLACASASRGTPEAKAIHQVDSILFHSRHAMIAVAFADIDSGAMLLRNEHTRFHAGSTMKVPVMLAAFEAIERGDLKLNQPIPIKNEFRSLADGSPYSLAASADSDPDLYAAIGGTRPLEDLIGRMIDRSSNLATNLLLDRLGASRVSDLMRRLGAYEMQVLRGVEDQKAYQAGLDNTTTAYDMMLVLGAIASGAAKEVSDPVVSRQSARKMIDILKRQEPGDKIPAGLPPGVAVAHKAGDLTGFHHDAAVVYPPGETPYVLVVLTSGFPEEKAANQVIAAISRAVWDGRQGLRQLQEDPRDQPRPDAAPVGDGKARDTGDAGGTSHPGNPRDPGMPETPDESGPAGLRQHRVPGRYQVADR
ncbi:MAG: class A beta-lactamase-related serine hydrolase [Acidobacteriota bacterium]|nr:class A beta-lactamase-related serine hydrolase [Acidobacteriota bacterium]